VVPFDRIVDARAERLRIGGRFLCIKRASGCKISTEAFALRICCGGSVVNRIMVIRKKQAVLLAMALLSGFSVCCFAQGGGVRDAEEESKVFESYFPDSNTGAEKLDQWWKNKDEKPIQALEALDIIQDGFRRTSVNRSMIVGWVGGGYTRHPEPIVRDRAIGLLHHASFSPEGYVRHFAVYYGLSVVQEKSAQVLDRLATLAMSNESVNRIVWGVAFTNQADVFLTHLEPYKNSPHSEVRERAETLAKLVKEQASQQQQQQQQKVRREQIQQAAEQDTLVADPNVDYETAFAELYETLANAYPCFELKGIDWEAVGKEYLPRAEEVKDDREFGLLCAELVARLEDSHAYLMDGAVKVPQIAGPEWDAGFSCLEDDRGRAAVYYVDKGGPAYQAGVKVGMVVLRVDGNDVKDVIENTMARMKEYAGFSSERQLRYVAHHFFMRQMEKGKVVRFEMLDTEGKTHEFDLASALGARYLPRLPVPREDIRDSVDVSWTMLDDKTGYIYVRRIRDGLEASLDKAVSELKGARGMIVDVRGNTGGGFERATSHANFYSDGEANEANRPRYTGPMALLIDSRCISAGEGWASWFIANKRARVFGETTAGASSRKEIYTLKNRLYRVQLPVKAYGGFLDRPIERRGLEPDVEVRQSAADLAKGRDTVLEAARQYLLEQSGAGAIDR
jgi:C-terminal processing protease CtpA/Prc